LWNPLKRHGSDFVSLQASSTLLFISLPILGLQPSPLLRMFIAPGRVGLEMESLGTLPSPPLLGVFIYSFRIPCFRSARFYFALLGPRSFGKLKSM